MSKNLYARIAPWVLLLSVVAVPGLLYGVRGALQGSNNDVRQWLPSGFRETQEYDWFLSQFGSEEMAVVSWAGATVEDERLDAVTTGLQSYVDAPAAEDAQATGGTMSEPTPAPAAPKYFKRVTSAAEALDQLMSPPVRLSKTEATRRLTGLLIGDEGQAAILVAVNEYGAKHRKDALATLERVARDEAGLSANELHIGGPTVDSVALDSESQRSRYLLTGLSVSLALALAWRCLREIRLVVIVFATAILAALVSIAIVYFSGNKMNLLLVMMPTLVYLTAMSGAVHLINYYRDALAEGHHADAPFHAVKAAFLPGLLCAATTAIGLGSLATSEVQPVRLFGTYSAFGVLAALPILYLFLPSALQLWPAREERLASYVPSHDVGDGPAWTRVLATWLGRRHAWVVAAGLLALAVTGFGVSQLKTSVKLLNLFSPESRIIRDYGWLEREIGPLVPVEVVVAFDQSSPLKMLDRMELVQKIESKLDGIEKVGGTMSAATFTPALPQGRSARKLVKRVLADRRLQEHRDYLQGTHYLQPGTEQELWRVSARVEALNALDYGHFVERIRQEVEPVLATASEGAPGSIQATYTGIVPLVYKAQRTLLHDLMSSFVSAFLIIGGMMVLLLRNFWAGLASMIPNVFPAVLIFGSMGLSGMLCDIGSMMTAGVALGIAVDDTIHFLSWFRRGIASGLGRHDAIVLAYRRCAVAMIQSSIICGLGLLVFAMSNFIPTARFAWLMAAMLSSALVGDLILLPAILAGPVGKFFERRQSVMDPAEESESDASMLPELVPATP